MLDKSGFYQQRSKMLNSMSLKVFLQTIEDEACDKDNVLKELTFVDDFHKHLEAELPDFTERTLERIRISEMSA